MYDLKDLERDWLEQTRNPLWWEEQHLFQWESVKKTNLRCASVENLSMKLIIGFPELWDLGLSTDLKHISEMEWELTEKQDIEVNIDKNVTEKKQDQLEK